MTIRAGIDLSMTSPVVCVHDDSLPLKFENCTIYSYGTYSYCAKLCGKHKNIIIHKQPSWESDIERFQRVAQWVSSIVKLHKITKVGIEDYSYNSKGKVFNIAEMTGIVKLELFKWKIPVTPIAISDIKKQFTGKGNAGKDQMYASFLSRTGVNLPSVIDYTSAGANQKTIDKLKDAPYDVKPLDDIVDAFAVLTCHPDFVEIK